MASDNETGSSCVRVWSYVRVCVRTRTCACSSRAWRLCVLCPDCRDGGRDGMRSGENGEEMLGITLGLPVRACG